MSQRAGQSVGIVLGGKAEVFCVHDRKKKEVVTEEQVMALAKSVNFTIRRGVHHIFNCACCDNLFVDDGTEPRLCAVCRKPPVHALGGPLPEPKGVVA